MTDGQQVLEFLYRQGEWSEAWTPDLVVLNIIMPKLNGWEVFERIKADSRLRTIPTVIWTVAQMEEYNARTYEWGASGIFSKPVDSKDMERQVDAIITFFRWANPYPRGM